jgi:ankyrin repeat protein
VSPVEQALSAVKAGDAAAFAAVLSSDPSISSARLDGGMSLLLMAAFFGRQEMVDLILSTGRSLDVYEAAALGRTGVLAGLLDANPALVNEYSPYGFTPLHHAAYLADAATVRLLLERGAEVNAVSRERMQLTALHQAAIKARRDSLQLLLDHGADPSPPHPEGYTPLHAAAAGGDLVSIRRLLTMGADPTATYQGRTPADIAAEHGHNDAAAAIRAELV